MDITIELTPPAKVHMIGVCGTGMGSLAGLLASRGFRVTGSDTAAYPPMSTQLSKMGIPIFEGYSPENLTHAPDLVVVGNVCRPDHPEAKAARDRGLLTASMAKTLSDLFLKDKNSIVVAGTHGKTTTTALTAFLLHATSRDPSFLVGGIGGNFDAGFQLGNGPDFVVEGDEYDSAYFEKIPKFLLYRPRAAAITSIEYDHIDIYKSPDEYEKAFETFSASLPDGAPLAVYCGDEKAVSLAKKSTAATLQYASEGDPRYEDADWLAIPKNAGEFELRIGGASAGRFQTSTFGRHNLRNTLAALILCHRASGVSIDDLKGALPNFLGVKRRQEIVGKPRGITVYDDFAHHPTAVFETLKALAARHGNGRLIVAFEPRSATACRRLHQEKYGEVFDPADFVVIAPPARELPEDEIIDTGQIAKDINKRGGDAVAAESIDEVLLEITKHAKPNDAVAMLSNGSFGGLLPRVLEALK